MGWKWSYKGMHWVCWNIPQETKMMNLIWTTQVVAPTSERRTMISVSHISLEIFKRMGMGLHVPKSFHFLSKVDFVLHCGEKLNNVTIHGQLAALFSTNLANQKWGRLSNGLHLHQQSQLVWAAMEKFNLFTCQSQGRWETLKPLTCVCVRTHTFSSSSSSFLYHECPRPRFGCGRLGF